MTFAKQLKQGRKKMGLTQKEMALFLGIPDRTHWDWDAGKTIPPEVTQEGCLARIKASPKS